ncbi:MAG TPA: hypothetical protein VEW26_15815 [Allosphingosinicella sp.]|nr:hypothetical protein [Allosphingosinicella sp.]
MIKKLGAALIMAFIATPALADHWPAREPVFYADPSSGSSSTSSGGSDCDRCGVPGPPHDDPVDVPAPPMALLFAAGAMALVARGRQRRRGEDERG